MNVMQILLDIGCRCLGSVEQCLNLFKKARVNIFSSHQQSHVQTCEMVLNT